jgi:hypothetical protein
LLDQSALSPHSFWVLDAKSSVTLLEVIQHRFAIIFVPPLCPGLDLVTVIHVLQAVIGRQPLPICLAVLALILASRSDTGIASALAGWF